MTRISYDIPRQSKKFFIEPVSESSHLKQKLLTRFTKFHQTLKNCDKPHVRYLMKIQERDYRSTFGKNVQNICKELDVDNIEVVNMNNFVYSPVPEGEEWKISLVKECLEMKGGRLESNLSQKEIMQIMHH